MTTIETFSHAIICQSLDSNTASTSKCVIMPYQAGSISQVASATVIYANNSGNIITLSPSNIKQICVINNTLDRTITYPDVSGTITLDTSVATFQNKTISGGVNGNDVSANKLTNMNVSATTPTNQQVLQYDSTGGNWVPTTREQLAWVVRDIKSIGTNAGSFMNGSWVTRTLNDLTGSASTNCTLASNQITLKAGTYSINATVPANSPSYHVAKLYNITASSDVAFGSTVSGGSVTGATTTLSRIDFIVTPTANTVYEIQHRCVTSNAGSDGRGGASGLSTETYTSVFITQLK